MYNNFYVSSTSGSELEFRIVGWRGKIIYYIIWEKIQNYSLTLIEVGYLGNGDTVRGFSKAYSRFG